MPPLRLVFNRFNYESSFIIKISDEWRNADCCDTMNINGYTDMEYIIDGAKFYSEKGFYNLIESLFTAGLSWKMGRDLDAFADIIEGGFGKHGYGEQITIIWINMTKSKSRLPLIF